MPKIKHYERWLIVDKVLATISRLFFDLFLVLAAVALISNKYVYRSGTMMNAQRSQSTSMEYYAQSVGAYNLFSGEEGGIFKISARELSV